MPSTRPNQHKAAVPTNPARERRQLLAAMEQAGWGSALRLVHGDAPHYSYWNPTSGNGFLIDHAFVAPPLVPRVLDCSLLHDGEGWPSDHAALRVNLQC